MLKFLRRLLGRPQAADGEDAGLWGEEQAAEFLKRRGFRILGRRVRVDRRDEIDIIARDGSIAVFVEVKTRRTERFGRPASAIGPGKRRSLSRAAVRYLKKAGWPSAVIRFDVVEVIGRPGGGAPEIRHIENAFLLDRRYEPPC